MTDTAIHEGGCLCGAVRYRITGTPRLSVLCHCRSCRRASGGPTIAWLILNGSDFQIISGRPEDFRSSSDVLRQFCGRCGTQLTYQRVTNPESIDVTVATLDDPNAFPPTREIWLDHRIAWESPNAVADQFAQSSVGATPLPRRKD
jgi:hypothetical protein